MWYQNMKTGAITSNPSGLVESLGLSFNSKSVTRKPFSEREMILINDKSISTAKVAKITGRFFGTIYNKRKNLNNER